MCRYPVNNLPILKLQSDTKIIFATKLAALNNSVKAFKIISTLEAISFLVLLGIAMPMKYIWDMPQMVQVVGMAHGVLFVLYVAGAVYMQQLLKWNFKTLAIVVLCSILPFGPFYVEKKYLNV